MKLKTKLSLGLGFLFLIIFSLCFFCSFYVQKLSRDAEDILKDNYHSLVYARNMLVNLDDMRKAMDGMMFDPSIQEKRLRFEQQALDSSKLAFEQNLQAEENNITELHEKEQVATLAQAYAKFSKLCDQIQKGTAAPQSYYLDLLPVYEKIKQSINYIYDLNMQAIVRNQQFARREAKQITIYMALIGTFCTILAFGYFWYFPFYISTTLSVIADKMKLLLKELHLPAEMATKDEAHMLWLALGLLEKELKDRATNSKKTNRQKPSA
jgi:hypothetical protein